MPLRDARKSTKRKRLLWIVGIALGIAALVGVIVAVVVTQVKKNLADGAVDLRFAEHLAEGKYQQPGEKPYEHAADEQRPDHGFCVPGTGCQSSVAGKADQMAPVVNEFVHVHAGDEAGGTLFRADEIDRQQQDGAEDGPWQQFPDRDGRRGAP